MRRFQLWWYRRQRTGYQTSNRHRAVNQSGQQWQWHMLLTVFIVLLGIGITGFWIQDRMGPQVEQLANSRVHYLAANAMNEAVSEAIARIGIHYDDLIHFEKDTQGRITALKTDMVMANRIKSDIYTASLAKIQNLSETDIGIPLGSLLEGDLLTGRGPQIGVRIVPVGTVNVSFSNQFSEAGINQTRHQILMRITTEIGVLLPGTTANQEVTVEVCIAETVIVGVVPEAYAQLDKHPVFDQTTQP